MQTIERKFYIDTLTILSCISVVFLHANGVFWSHPSGRLWLTSNLIECIFYFAVPVFFMISGATLLEYRKRYDTNTYLKKRVRRTLIPFVAWSIIGFSIHFLILKKIPSISDVIQLPLDIINCKYFGVYWFFIPLFTCYLSIIYLSRLIQFKKIIVFLIIWISFSTSIIPFLNNLFGWRINETLMTVPPGGGYILYILLGFFLSQIKFAKFTRYLVYLCGLVGFLLHFLGTWYLGLEPTKPINMLFKGYLNFPSVLFSIAIFTLIKHNPLIFIYNSRIFTPFVLKIKENSLGIYLIHAYFLYYIFPKISLLNTSSIYYRLLSPFFLLYFFALLSVI